MKTFVREKVKVELKNPILIEGLPGLGMVGRIATRYLIRHLHAERYAQLFSPHFPYYVVVNRHGNARLLRGLFYYWKNPSGENDLILLTGDSQAQTIEGQYEVAECIIDFAKKRHVNLIVTLGGFRRETEATPRVIVAATKRELLRKALQANAITGSTGNPIVGIAGLILGLARFKGIDAVCLLGETRGYVSDPKAAKSVLDILRKMLNLPLDLSGLDEMIKKSEKILEKMRKIEERRMMHMRMIQKTEERRTTYIS